MCIDISRKCVAQASEYMQGSLGGGCYFVEMYTGTVLCAMQLVK